MKHNASNADPLFPETLPFRTRHLQVYPAHSLYLEQCGRRDGLPVVFLHGGPGSGCSPAHRRFFDPLRFHAVLFDQRGCGRSTPLAELRDNTTPHLVADLELIREALGIERWLVFGGSWGSLLALSYAIANPARCAGLVLRSIFLGSDDELRRYAQGLDRVAPLAWQAFAAGVPEAERNGLLSAYTLRLLAGDPAATRRWLDYERALMGVPPLAAGPTAVQGAKARIQGHYLSQHCFSDVTALLAGCAGLRQVPIAIVQGSRDPVCPPRAAERLQRALPHAEWMAVEAGRHNVFAADMAAACIRALDRIATRGRF